MKSTFISLNGAFEIDYISEKAYEEKTPPIISDSAVTLDAVPGYFEDMYELFSEKLKSRIAINPLFEKQRYPMTGSVPDMALPNPVGSFAYRRTFTLNDIGEDAQLFIGGVQNKIYAWINGKFIGSHEGYSAEFSIPVQTDLLKLGENEIVFAVSNTRLEGYMQRPVSGLTSRAANECTGGIYGDVELRFLNGGAYGAWVTCSKNLDTFTVNFCANQKRERVLTVFDGEKELTRVKLSGEETAATLSTSGYEFWTPDSPKLYRLLISDGENELWHSFGIRRLTAEGMRLYLNGEPFLFRGFCEHCYHPITVHPARSQEYYEEVIKKAKALGFNSIRSHTYVPPCEYLAAADLLGMVVEVETPNNTTEEEWQEIVKMARRYTSVMIYSSGNEMMIDEDYIEHLRKAASFVHNDSDSLFSPMSAMRGIEYFSFGDCKVDEPFTHNPKRLAALSEFCDVYNSYSLGDTSYNSTDGTPEVLNERNSIYKKPLLSHEICIHGTYCDLSLKSRYEGTRIGKTAIFTSVEEHLEDKRLIEKADIYYENSVKWQEILRKECFELVRKTDTFAGYDFLGDIDTHWHTFGYCVGLMNEFYELKPSLSEEKIRRYNSDAVLLSRLPSCQNLSSGDALDFEILLSNYGEDIRDEILSVRIKSDFGEILKKSITHIDAKRGELKELCHESVIMPEVKKPTRLTLSAVLGDIAINEWTLYVFPKCNKNDLRDGVFVTDALSAEELYERLASGERVVIFGAKPFQYEGTSFRISLAGRTNGHLATVLNEHPLTAELDCDGFCNEAFRCMLNGARAAILDHESAPYAPIIEIATSYKNAHREALLFEYSVGAGKLLVCGLNFEESDKGAAWIKEKILDYAASDDFAPRDRLTQRELFEIIGANIAYSEKNTNLAMNKNDITAN